MAATLDRGERARRGGLAWLALSSLPFSPRLVSIRGAFVVGREGGGGKAIELQQLSLLFLFSLLSWSEIMAAVNRIASTQKKRQEKEKENGKTRVAPQTFFLSR